MQKAAEKITLQRKEVGEFNVFWEKKKESNFIIDKNWIDDVA